MHSNPKIHFALFMSSTAWTSWTPLNRFWCRLLLSLLTNLMIWKFFCSFIDWFLKYVGTAVSILSVHTNTHLSEWLKFAEPPLKAPPDQCGWTHQSRPRHQTTAGPARDQATVTWFTTNAVWASCAARYQETDKRRARWHWNCKACAIVNSLIKIQL